MAMLEREIRHLAKQAGGAHKTVSDRMAQAKRFCERLIEQNVQIRYVKHLKARHIEDYIRHRLAQGIDKRTLQNEMAMVRVVLRQAGRVKLARLMGLRSQEAVQSAQSLKTWQQTLDRGESRLTVVFGTKGGRPRETMILDAGAVKKALDLALSVAENRYDRLIDKPDLKSAMKYWHSQASYIGLTGAYSPHSLRYAWAQEAIRHYLGEKEALALMAMDLGHGDGRGRYVAQVYGRREEAD
ncbi:integrase domain-containing protein [Salmonella enterica]|nr:integrase domain-containing protein [Salmonella enterica]